MKKGIKVLLAILTSFSLFIRLDEVDVISRTYSFNFLELTLSCLLIFFLYDKYLKGKKIDKLTLLLSIILSIFMVIGYSMENNHSLYFVIGNLSFMLISFIKIVSFTALFYACINAVNSFVLKNNKKEYFKNNKFITFIKKHPFITSFVIILLCWLPYIISYYPSILSPDPSNQIKQFLGIRTVYSDYSVMLDESVTITNHHPVFHTVLLGGCVKLGLLFGSANLGLFLYSIIQIIVMISVLSYSIKYLNKLKVPSIYQVILILMYALIPVFPFYAMSPVKDVLFSCFIMMYVIMLYDLLRFNKYKWYNYFGLLLIMILVCIQRQNGIYTIYLTFPFLFLIKLKNKKVLGLLLVLLVTFFYSYTKILLPSLHITDGSIREMLSIPFQQTARYVRDYKLEVTKKEKQAIDKVLGYKNLAKRYKTRISDPVKNGFNKYATNEDLKEYFKVWFKQFTKHPVVYFEATLDNTYGYFYPDTSYWYFYHNYDERLIEDGIDYHYNDLELARDVLHGFGTVYPYFPVIGLFVNIGFNTWLYLYILYLLIQKKKYRYIIVIGVALSLILVCFASPVNTYFRYSLPYVMSLPITVCMLLSLKRNHL